MKADTTLDPTMPNASEPWNGENNGQDETMKINTGFELRNIFIGSLGIVFNSLAFFVIFKSKKINHNRKLILLNLVQSDILLMVAICIYGVVHSTQVSDGDGCKPIVIFIVVGILTSYMFALLLSGINYLAVKMPLKYRHYLTMKNCGIAVAFVWFLSISFCVGFIGVERLTPGKTCAPLVIIPRGGIFMMTLLTFASFVGVMSLNTAVVIRLRQSFDTLEKRNPNIRRQKPPDTLDPKHNIATPPVVNKLKLSRHKVQPVTTDTSTTPPSSSTYFRTTSSDLSCPNFNPPKKPRAHPCETVPRANMPVTFIQVQPQSAQPGYSASPADQRRAVVSTNDAQIDKICKTLLVLTTYSCLMTLPLILYLTCIITYVIEDPETLVTTPVGILISSLPMINACINPFFYGLNFVNWRVVWAKLRGRRF